MTFPADYPSENVKGKDAVFDVTVKAVKVASDAKADDEFAKSLGLESLDKLREVLREQQGQELNGLIRTHMKRQLLDAIIQALRAQDDAEGLVAIARRETDPRLKEQIVRALSTMTKSKAALEYLMELINK